MRTRSFVRRGAALMALGIGLLGSPGGPLRAQPASLRVSVDTTELRWSATGRLLGRLERGVELERLGGRGGWARVGVRGWMWSASLEREGSGFRVAPETENLRASPGGRVMGQLVRGVAVRRVGSEGRWEEIALIGWLPVSSVTEDRPEPTGTEPAPAETAATATADTTPPPPVRSRPAEDEAVPAAAMGTLARAAEMRNAPEGEAVAALPPNTAVRVLESRGGWTRIRVDGWVPSTAVRAGALGEVGPDVVASAPAGTFIGRTVRWTLEHVALQQADAWRPDFTAGEWYDLARVPGVEGRYVYLALPERLVEEFRAMSPFRTVRIEGRVRTGQSALTGTPIVEVTRLLP